MFCAGCNSSEDSDPSVVSRWLHEVTRSEDGLIVSVSYKPEWYPPLTLDGRDHNSTVDLDQINAALRQFDLPPVNRNVPDRGAFNRDRSTRGIYVWED